MYLADIVYVETNGRILTNRTFNHVNEDEEIDELIENGVIHSSSVKRMNNYLEEYLRV
jgi:hypothetical protein